MESQSPGAQTSAVHLIVGLVAATVLAFVVASCGGDSTDEPQASNNNGAQASSGDEAQPNETEQQEESNQPSGDLSNSTEIRPVALATGAGLEVCEGGRALVESLSALDDATEATTPEDLLATVQAGLAAWQRLDANVPDFARDPGLDAAGEYFTDTEIFLQDSIAYLATLDSDAPIDPPQELRDESSRLSTLRNDIVFTRAASLSELACQESPEGGRVGQVPNYEDGTFFDLPNAERAMLGSEYGDIRLFDTGNSGFGDQPIAVGGLTARFTSYDLAGNLDADRRWIRIRILPIDFEDQSQGAAFVDPQEFSFGNEGTDVQVRPEESIVGTQVVMMLFAVDDRIDYNDLTLTYETRAGDLHYDFARGGDRNDPQ